MNETSPSGDSSTQDATGAGDPAASSGERPSSNRAKSPQNPPGGRTVAQEPATAKQEPGRTPPKRSPKSRGALDDDDERANVATEFIDRLTHWAARLVAALAVLYAIWWFLGAAVRVEGNRLWYGSVHASSVYGTILGTQILLFLLFGGLAGLVGLACAIGVRRIVQRPGEEVQPTWREWLGRHPRLTRWGTWIVATLVPLLRVGAGAAGQWQIFQMWAHAKPWGQTDQTYHRDISYYVEVYPMHRMVVNELMSVVHWAVLVTLVFAFIHGVLRFFGPARGVSRPVVAQLSVIGVCYLIVHCFALWLDRSASVISNRSVVTGASYTDLNAVDPGKLVLIVVALLLAALYAYNVKRAKLRILIGGVFLSLVASTLIGVAWPTLVMRLRERPTASLEIPLIRENQQATKEAFGLAGDVTTKTYGDSGVLAGAKLGSQVKTGAQLRVLDPNRLSPTFNVMQQLQSYYGFKSTLDIDRYQLKGKSTDVAIAARELHVNKVPVQTWANTHLVYTHGYGIVAAPTDSMNSGSDIPNFLDGGTKSKQQIKVNQPDIYFGQAQMPYSIVGGTKSSGNLEFDHASGSGSSSASFTTYHGDGGIPMGSLARRILYAVTLKSPNILFSGQINSASRILTVRNPKARVAKVAPWLTLDGDVYPAVVDGRIKWIVDGYTTSNTYPNSQQINLNSATSSTLTRNGSNQAQPSKSVNYMRNSVKAVVDAYTGNVTLYAWDQGAHPDPILSLWRSVFPKLIQPQSAMSSSLLAHVRYPQDLFDVQRALLTRYHVNKPADFYSGNDFWQVPSDPTVAATQALNSSGSAPAGLSLANRGAPNLPSVYMSQSPTGYGKQTFALSSPLVTLNKRQLAGYLTVNANPGPGYGKMTLLEFPPGTSAGSPGEIQNQIESTTKISETLTLQRGGNSRVVLGNLLTVPMGGQMLYLEPIYTQASGGNSFPILRHVVAIFGNGSPAFSNNLQTAVQQALANAAQSSSSANSSAVSSSGSTGSKGSGSSGTGSNSATPNGSGLSGKGAGGSKKP